MYVCVFVRLYKCIYIYREREREKEKEIEKSNSYFENSNNLFLVKVIVNNF